MSGEYWTQGHVIESSEVPYDELPPVERKAQPEHRTAFSDAPAPLGQVAVEGPSETFDTSDMTIRGN